MINGLAEKAQGKERRTKAVFPAKIKNACTKIIKYAFWNGMIDWSTSDMPVLV
jgi:hypothetical protein